MGNIILWFHGRDCLFKSGYALAIDLTKKDGPLVTNRVVWFFTSDDVGLEVGRLAEDFVDAVL